MRTAAALLLLLLCCSCASSAGRIVAMGGTREYNVDELAGRIADADVIFLGELHDNAEAHRLHHALLLSLHMRRPDLVLSMEMFERDVQHHLDRYLAGEIDDGPEFRQLTRAWGNFATDYKPMLDFARHVGVPVIAANVPRPLAAMVAKEGLDAVRGAPYAPREVNTQRNEYWDRFAAAMGGDPGHGGGHGGGNGARLQRFYESQCIKDDAMAESIADHLAARTSGRPLVVHVCGSFHSDYRLGTVERLVRRAPKLDIVVLTAVTGDDREASVPDRPIADYLLVVPD